MRAGRDSTVDANATGDNDGGHQQIAGLLPSESKQGIEVSDLLEDIGRFGLGAVLEGIYGRFVLVYVFHDIWTIARDHCGEEQVYYWNRNGDLFFADNLAWLLRSLPVSPEYVEDLDSVRLFETPVGEETSYAGVKRLPPGSMLEFNSVGSNHVTKYWSVDGLSQVVSDPDQAAQNVQELLKAAIRRRSRFLTKGTVGAFVSGGLDSSYISALASAEGIQLRAGYTCAWPALDSVYDESCWTALLLGISV